MSKSSRSEFLKVFSKQCCFIRCRRQHIQAVEYMRYSRFTFVENTIGSFHGRSSNGCQVKNLVKNFKFLQISTIDRTHSGEIILNIFLIFLWNFWSKIKISWKFDYRFWIMYSIPCYQFLRILRRLVWLYGNENCKFFEKSIKN